MSSGLSWVFELIDRMSGPARRMHGSLHQFRSELRAVRHSASGLERIIGTMPRHSQRFGVAAYNYLGRRFGTGVTQGITSAANSLVNMNDALGAVGINLSSVARTASLGVVGAFAAIGVAAVAAGAKLGALGVEFGLQASKFAIQTTSFQEDSLTTLEVLMRDKTAAARVFDKAVQIASDTPFETNEAIEGVKQLIAGGFKEGHLDRMMRSLSDMASVTGDRMAMHRVVYAIKQIKSMDKLRSEELNLQLGEAGLPVALVKKHLAEMMGLKNAEAAEKAIRTSKVNANTGIAAVLKAIDERFQNASEARSKTLSGRISTLVSRPSELLFAANGESTKPGGFDAIKGMISELASLLDAKSATGSGIVAIIREIGTASGDVFKGISIRNILLDVVDALRVVLPGIKQLFVDLNQGIRAVIPNGANLQIAFTAIMNAARIAIPVVSGFVQGFATGLAPLFGTLATADVTSWGQKLGKAAEVVGTWIGYATSAVSMFIGGLSYLIGLDAQIDAWYSNLGARIVDGLVKGISSAGSKVWAALKKILWGSVENSNALLEVRSPSRVFARIGEYSGLGFGVGFHAANIPGIVTGSFHHAISSARAAVDNISMHRLPMRWDASLAALTPSTPFGPAGASAATLLSGRAALSIGHLEVSAPVYLSSDDSRTKEAAERAIARLLPSALDDALGRLALELGA